MNQIIDRTNLVSGNVFGARYPVSDAQRQLRLLCATDFSSRSDRAAWRAVLLSRQLGADLLLFHSIDAARTERMTRRKKVRAQLILNARARKLALSGSVPQISVRVGQYQDAIASMAREWDADLIVLGAHRARIGDSFVGTTAERVIRKARRPVLVVNREARGSYEHVLLTSDLSKVSSGAARLTQDLGLLEGAVISVVHATTSATRSMLRFSGVSEPEIDKYEREIGRQTSEEVVQQFETAGLLPARLSVITDQASPLRSIEHAARLTHADLVVVGASRFPVLKRVMLGSISNEVLRSLTCDVLLVSPGAIKRMREVEILEAELATPVH